MEVRTGNSGQILPVQNLEILGYFCLKQVVLSVPAVLGRRKKVLHVQERGRLRAGGGRQPGGRAEEEGGEGEGGEGAGAKVRQ